MHVNAVHSRLATQQTESEARLVARLDRLEAKLDRLTKAAGLPVEDRGPDGGQPAEKG